MAVQFEIRLIVVDLVVRSLDASVARKVMEWVEMDLDIAGPPVPVSLSQILDELVGRFRFSEQEAQHALIEAAVEIAAELEHEQLLELAHHLSDDLRPLFYRIDTHTLAS